MRITTLVIFFIFCIDSKIPGAGGNEFLVDTLKTVQCGKNDFHQILIITDYMPELYPLKDCDIFIVWITNPISLQRLPMSTDSPNLSTLITVSFTKMTGLEEALLQIIELERWDCLYLILVPTMSNNKALHDIIDNVASYIPLHSDVYWISQQEESRSNLEIWEAYSIKGIYVFSLVISLRTSDPLLFTYFKTNKWKRRRNFSGAIITSTAVVDPDYMSEVNILKSDDGNLTVVDGLAVDVFRIFRDEFNFTENFIEGAYILDNSDPEIPGMEHHLINGTADISITETTAGEDKAALVRMLHVTVADWVDARFIKRSTNGVRFFRIPFTWAIWFFIAIQILIFTLVFRIFHCILFKEGIIHWYERSVVIEFLCSFGTVCLKCFYVFPSSRPLQILFLVASISGYLLNISYTAVMTAQLSVKEKTFATLETLLDRKYKFFLEEDVPFPIDLQAFPKWSDVQVEIVGSDESLQISVGKEIATSPSALVSFPEHFNAAMKRQNVSDQDACSMFEAIRVSKIPNQCSMTVPKSSPFKEIFNIQTLEISEHGLLTRLNRKYKGHSRPRCSNRAKLIPQTIAELAVVYYIMLGGSFIAFIAVFIERMSARELQWIYSTKSVFKTKVISFETTQPF